METFTEKYLGHNSAVHITSYLPVVISKILPRSKTMKDARKFLVFGENDFSRLSISLQNHIF